MRILRATLIILFTAAAAHAQNPKLTDAQRAQIITAVQKVVDEVYAGAREINFDRMSAHMSKEDGVCLFGQAIRPCNEVKKGFAEAWRRDRPDRPQRQEMDGQEIRIMPLSPTMAVVATTTKENRVYLPDGKVNRASFASFFVYVLEDGQWKMHSGQQAAWPIEPAGK